MAWRVQPRLSAEQSCWGYKEVFNSIRSLVDVGGRTGGLISNIVKAYPHIKGVNFDA
ncbi:hypothetical protein Golax_018247, partial [Gossypium laxum]|nr:hypothetical protein [Gossypium laxum]